MSASFYEKGNVRVRTDTGPNPSLQCQTQLLDGQHPLVSMDLPNKPGTGSVAIRLSARVDGKEFEEVTGDGPTWLPKAVRDLFIKLVGEAVAKIPKAWNDPSADAARACNHFVDALEKVRASAIN